MWLSQETNHNIGKQGIVNNFYNMLFSEAHTQLKTQKMFS